MSDTDSIHHQTELKETLAAHGGSGDININVLVPGFENAIKVIKQLSTGEEADAFKKLISAFRQLKYYQGMVSELKYFHHMLHNLETALDTIDSPLQMARMQNKTLEFYSIQRNWRNAVRPYIRDMSHFASKEMKLLNEPHLQIIEGQMKGPAWLLELIDIQTDFEASLKENNIQEIFDLSSIMLDVCRDHLFFIDRQLFEAITKLNQLSDQILGRIDDAY